MKTQRKRITVITNTKTGKKIQKFQNTNFQELENNFLNFFKKQNYAHL